MEKFEQDPELDIQRLGVTNLYDSIAEKYDTDFESKAEYQVPEMLKEIYKKYNISEGDLLDIGCGTGKIKEYLGDGFNYSGIDLSPSMLEKAKSRGIKVYPGPAEEIIKGLGEKSVDHVTALSSLYFIKDLSDLIHKFERVARQSIFVTLEQFTPEIIEVMKNRGIQLYNHSAMEVDNPTEIMTNTYLWKRPNTEDKIFGDVVFKKF